MGKYNKVKEQQHSKTTPHKRFCPKCRWQSFEWKCPACGTSTRRVNIQGTIEGVLSG
jgi:hypothetical protein